MRDTKFAWSTALAWSTAVAAVCLVATGTLAAGAEEIWPGWRGPNHDGTTSAMELPVEFGAEDTVAWKLELPARSGATPAVAGDRIFVAVSYNPEDKETLELWAVDGAEGEVLWKRDLGGGNEFRYKHHDSSPSPVTDGETVWVVTGTGVLAAFDLEGKELWRRQLQQDYGPFGMKFGYASSPLLDGGDLFLQVLHSSATDVPSYLLRIDGKTGETRWRTERPTSALDESSDAYSTPMPLRREGALEIMVAGGDVLTGHDAATGKELWRVAGLNPSNSPRGRLVASPLIVGDRLFAFGKRGPVLAFELPTAAGSPPQPLWAAEKGTDVPTPVSDGRYLYVINDKGIVTCHDAATGKVLYGPERLAVGTYSGSPLLATEPGHVYAVSESGAVTVFATGPKFEIVATSNVGGYTLSSLAVAGDRLLVRTEEALWAFHKAAPPKPTPAATAETADASR